MTIQKVLFAALAASSMAFGAAGISKAQAVYEEPLNDSDVVIDDADVAPDADTVVVDPDANLTDGNSVRVIDKRRAPAVYGWSRRNGCGTFHFWDGEKCVDARAKPSER